MNKKKADESKVTKAKETTFKCKFCESLKPIDEMVILTEYFPPTIACRDCEREIQ